MNFNILPYLKPFLEYVPEVQRPERDLPFKSKFLYTALCLSIFLLCSQVPLFGIRSASNYDPWYWSRMIMASNRGTLMELGISPIVTSGLVVQLLTGSKLLKINPNNRAERSTYESIQKLLGLLITIGQAVTYVISGTYGDVGTMGVSALLIILQLITAGLLVIFLDELMQKGYGLDSAISLFIATNICETIIWKAFSPYSIAGPGGLQFEGAFIAFFHLLITRSDKTRALKEAFYRQNLPNLTNILATFVIFLIVIYFQGFRIDIPISSKNARSASGTYPIKLFYTSNIPIILQAALVSNYFFVSQLLYKYFPNILVSALGTWEQHPYYPSQSIPVGGLAYYISAPGGLEHIISDPLHTIVYVIFVLASCALFSRTWVDISGSSPEDVAKQLKDQQMMIKGRRDESTLKTLQRYIPTSAAFGGLCVGVLSIMADFMGAVGSGTGILLAVTTIYSTFETITKEQSKVGGLDFLF